MDSIVSPEPRQGDKGKCRHCRQPITYYETAIDDFWAHDAVKSQPGLMQCIKYGIRQDTYAEPQEV